MKVELLATQGLNRVSDYWKISRPHLSEVHDLDEVLKQSLPVNSLITYTLKVTSSILIRDLLYSVRPIVSGWAVSNRATKFDQDHLTVSDEVIGLLNSYSASRIHNSIDDAIRRVENGELQEYVKKSLPLGTETTYIVEFDLRTLCNLFYTIELHNNEFFEFYIKGIIDQLGLPYDIVNKKDMYNKLCVLDSDRSNGKLGTMRQIYSTPAIVLMAQMIRKNDAIIKNGLWNAFLCVDTYRDLYDLKCDDEIELVMYCDDSTFNGMCSSRTCFFAMMDKEDNASWSYVLKDAVKNMTPEEFLKQLPCGGCLPCKIEKDMVPRVHGTEPNPPCPILVENPQIVLDRMKEFGSDSEIMKKWEEVMKYINDNPNNEYRKIYEEHLNGN